MTQPGVIVRDVEDDSPAADAGIRSGDVIVEINRRKVTNVGDMTDALDDRPAGTAALLLVHRGTDSLYVTVTP